MASAFLSSYLETIESVPSELQRNFTMMCDLDKRVHDIMKEIENSYGTYLEKANSLEKTEKAKYIMEMRHKFKKCNTFSDDKVQLAMQTYEMVDKHIRRLDTDLQRLEAKQRSQEQKQESQMFVDKTTDKKKQKQKGAEVQARDPVSSLPFSLISGTGEGLDMPVDPNEPTYCLCHQVSYGEMIGCDNTDCPVEWFHFACVGLSSKPKGSWYCPLCTKEMGK